MKQIPNFNDYFATKDGKIWSAPKGYNNKKGKFLKLYAISGGYLGVRLVSDKKLISKKVHRLILETFVGPCPKNMECRHLDGKRQNNNLENLCWGTRKENQHDRIQHGTNIYAKGEKHGRAKLTEQDICTIRKLHKSKKFNQYQLANKFNVSRKNIFQIINKKTWVYL